MVNGEAGQAHGKQDQSDKGNFHPIARPSIGEDGKIVIRQEMREMANALAHPEGDPYLNGRDLGFYCEQCG